MSLKITFLGSGPSLGVPIPTCKCATCTSYDEKDKRLRSSVLVEIDSKNILIDCGPDFRQQAIRADLRKIDYVLITHKHNDHLGGLDDIRPFNYTQGERIKLFASSEVLSDIKRRFYYAFEKTPYPGAPKIDLYLIDSKTNKIEDIEIAVISGLHGDMEVFGYRFGKLAYLTDFKTISEKELRKLSGIEVLVINALHPIHSHRLHLNIREALEIKDYLNPAATYFTHLSHHFAPYLISSSKLPPGCFLAYDGLSLVVE